MAYGGSLKNDLFDTLSISYGFLSDKTFFLIAGLLLSSFLIPACTPFGLIPFFNPTDARFEDPAIIESSGIVKSRRLEGVFWTHNDSGDRPRLFAVGRDGSRMGTINILGATNIDWEDIAIDDAGFLYLCDIGNNRNQRDELVIYRIPEADPKQTQQVTAASRFRFRYPDLRSPDAEACFFLDRRLYILTKEPGNGRTTLFRLNLSDPNQIETATFVGETTMESPVTGADITPDGSLLAVLSYSFIDLFSKPTHQDKYLMGDRRRVPIRFGQAEGIAWDGGALIVTNEAGGILWVDSSRLISLQLNQQGEGSEVHPFSPSGRGRPQSKGGRPEDPALADPLGGPRGRGQGSG